MVEHPSPEDLARLIAKRPGMYLGDASYERTIGFLTGLASLVSIDCVSTCTNVAPDEFTADSGSKLLGRIAAVRREPGLNEREAILALEPLLAETLTASRESCTRSR